MVSSPWSAAIRHQRGQSPEATLARVVDVESRRKYVLLCLGQQSDWKGDVEGPYKSLSKEAGRDVNVRKGGHSRAGF